MAISMALIATAVARPRSASTSQLRHHRGLLGSGLGKCVMQGSSSNLAGQHSVTVLRRRSRASTACSRRVAGPVAVAVCSAHRGRPREDRITAARHTVGTRDGGRDDHPSTCRSRSTPSQCEDIALDIVYEDEELIVIDKPVGMVVHPAAGNETGTLVNALLAHCRREPVRASAASPARASCTGSTRTPRA